MKKKAEAVEGASMAEAISSSARGVAVTTTNKAMSMEETMEVMKQIKEVQVDKGVHVNAAKAIAAAAADIRDDFLKIASAQESMKAADQDYERMNEPTTPTTRDSDDGLKMLKEKIKKLIVDAIVDAMPVIKMQSQRGPRVGDSGIKEQIMDARCGRATWSPEMKKMFIDLCLEQVKLGGRPGSNLKTSAWKKVREDFNHRNLVNYNKKQFKNYWDMLRKQWNTWKKLISLTGIGEVAPGQTVQMDQERWDAHIKAYPDAKQFRYKPLPHADEMEQLFGGVTAIGITNSARLMMITYLMIFVIGHLRPRIPYRIWNHQLSHRVLPTRLILTLFMSSLRQTTRTSCPTSDANGYVPLNVGWIVVIPLWRRLMGCSIGLSILLLVKHLLAKVQYPQLLNVMCPSDRPRGLCPVLRSI
ncbi:hypothetical protein QJS10_CPA16g01101 [Acorus calamus]|uniref:Myb/SANT-like domain-containing protein n=1 Tax=Acorus calamus TaxID=4465 RepID=A0AAV9D364_ACOCL|nr:hypothetical protein QJS10_CPA16g01101 [Acorus calamus]